MVGGRTFFRLLLGGAVAVAVPAAAAAQTPGIVIRAGPLSAALHDLARQAGIDLFFDEAVVRGLEAPAVRGRMSAATALERLLRGTNLVARRAASGAFIIERRPRPASPQPRQRELEDLPEPPIAEILVVGKRTQNVDVRRREDDVQPYQVTTGERIARAHRDNLDQYFRSRVTANTQVLPPSLLDDGETRSEIDLRGLGPGGTLILLDGRRMPNLPQAVFGFRQPDLNAIPFHAIDRVETLTGTAGGIYGFGALGGVVNVILKRDYRGVELHGTAGITSRGDARRVGIEGRLGFTPNGGRTDVMLYASHVSGQPLLVGQRDYALEDRRALLTRAPELFDVRIPVSRYGNSVGVFALATGTNLVFKPEYGGAALGSDRTFLPIGFQGSTADLVASLTERAGQVDLSLSDSAARSELGSHASTSAALLNIRHDFGGGVEGFLDAVLLRNRGTNQDRQNDGLIFLFPDSPANPFTQFVLATFPAPPRRTLKQPSFETDRYTAGLVVPLAHGWRGTAEATYGTARYDADVADRDIYIGPLIGELAPLGPWDEFQEAASAFLRSTFFTARLRNRYRELSLRLGGPLFRTSAGPATLTLLAQQRREKVPSNTTVFRFGPDEDDPSSRITEAERISRTTSFYGELRAPLVGEAAPLPFLRELELQLAVRRDTLRADFSEDPASREPLPTVRHGFAATSYTAGAKASPRPWLMLRGSYATGRQPPPLDALIERQEVSTFFILVDPKRGNSFMFPEGPVLIKSQGSRALEMAQASTTSLGAVLTPLGPEGPRLSVDYSRIRRTGDVVMLMRDQVLAMEDKWPERVGREPLSDEDRARGFTGGRITMIDHRAINGRKLSVKTLDATLDWPIRLFDGRLRVYGTATLQMENIDEARFSPEVENVGYRFGPLKWRANAGVDWSRGPLTVGANLQYFGRYRISATSQEEDDAVKVQGSQWVSSQAYLDLYATRRFSLGGTGFPQEISLDFGIVNVLDTAPPFETGISLPGPGYSRYGDPRRRRFELVLSANF